MDTIEFLAIRRDDRYSPNSVEKDRLILQACCDRLVVQDERFVFLGMIDEAAYAEKPVRAPLLLNMARSLGALQALAGMQEQGSKVINSAESVLRCQRSTLERLMRENHVAMPPLEGRDGYWLKRGDAAAQSKEDIRFCADARALQEVRQQFHDRGIDNLVVSSHVVGDLVKFYAVGHQMFRYFYPSDDGISKFGDERINGMARHFAFDEDGLRREVERLASLVGTDVYGGDAIIEADGRVNIIDFNDWPSFSRCRDEVAECIAVHVVAETRARKE